MQTNFSRSYLFRINLLFGRCFSKISEGNETNSIKLSGSLLSPDLYEKIGSGKIATNKDRWSVRRKEHRRRIKEQEILKQKSEQVQKDKESSQMTIAARKRKLKAITEWAQREHPHIWQYIVQKVALRDFLQGKPWEPAVLLSYEEMERIKELRSNNPKEWTYRKLARKFEISVMAATKIAGSTFTPTPEQRVTRQLQRNEFKTIQKKFLIAVANRERERIIEGDLQSRYGVLYSPPPPKPMSDLLNKYLFSPNRNEIPDSDEEDPETMINSKNYKNNHLEDYESPGGLDSVYRRITAEAKAVVAARIETDKRFKENFVREVARITQLETEQKEKNMFFAENVPEKKPKFFDIFEDDNHDAQESASSKKKINYFPKKKPIRNVLRWPEDAMPNEKM